MIASYPYCQYTLNYNAADEGRQAGSYGKKLIDFIIIQAQIISGSVKDAEMINIYDRLYRSFIYECMYVVYVCSTVE